MFYFCIVYFIFYLVGHDKCVNSREGVLVNFVNKRWKPNKLNFFKEFFSLFVSQLSIDIYIYIHHSIIS